MTDQKADQKTDRMIEVNPNIRIAGKRTFTYLRSDEQADLYLSLRRGDQVVVFQPEMNMKWPAVVTKLGPSLKGITVKDQYGYVELDVAWAKWEYMTKQPPFFQCLDCWWVSYNKDDIENGYCGNCHAFTGDPK